MTEAQKENVAEPYKRRSGTGLWERFPDCKRRFPFRKHGDDGGFSFTGDDCVQQDVVLIQTSSVVGDPTVITINCPDKTGLGCDLCRIILEFGLSISRGDVSTDGKWCYIVLWVVPQSRFLRSTKWSNLNSRLVSACPSCSVPFYYIPELKPQNPPMCLLTFVCSDRKGLLHDVTHVLTELEFTIQRVKVSTTPDGGVLDLFFITDARELLHTKQRLEDTCIQLTKVLGDSCQSCDLKLAAPEYETCQHGFSSLPLLVADAIFSSNLLDSQTYTESLVPDLSRLEKVTFNVDNFLSPSHTVLQIECLDQKCLLYDILRALKDCKIKIAYARFSSRPKGFCEVYLLIMEEDGKKISDPERLQALLSRLRTETLHPLRVTIVDRGPDTELLVANPVELCGKGRPRVFYDVTLALKSLGICIFSAVIGRHVTPEHQWEVYRFLLDDAPEFPLQNSRARKQIVDRVKRTLMGW